MGVELLGRTADCIETLSGSIVDILLNTFSSL